MYFEECDKGEYHAPFPSEEALDLALDWYNDTPKRVQIKYCAARNFSLIDPRTDNLFPQWEVLSCMVYAWNDQLPEARAMLDGVFAAARESELE